MERKEIVSTVIVSMNKLDNLRICLPSIRRYTKILNRVYVIAYLFSPDNLKKLREEFDWITIIESNEIRGFAENNNLALRDINTKYIFILNDDTEFKVSVIDNLVNAMNKTLDATVMSPVLFRGDGSLQFNGRRYYSFWNFFLRQIGVKYFPKSMYENGSGIYQSYNISGAAFLIKTDVFRNVGFFDEKYFFCPEDIALSTLLNKQGYKCYVDATTPITHYEGVSSKKTKLFFATTISAFLGSSYFYCTSKFQRSILLILWKLKYITFLFLSQIYNKNSRYADFAYIYNKVELCFRKNISCKEIFIKEYRKVSNQ